MRAALISNANLAGDSCNRGPLLAVLLGLSMGSTCTGSPAVSLFGDDLCRGLRYWSIIEPNTARFARRCSAACSSTALSHCAVQPTLRFGRPWPLPVFHYYNDGDEDITRFPGQTYQEDLSPLRLPRDFRGKLAAVASLLQAIPMEQRPRNLLRFLRRKGPVFIVVTPGEAPHVVPMPSFPGAVKSGDSVDARMPWWPIVTALRTDRHRHTPGGAADPLDEGVAASDRAEVMRQMQGPAASVVAPASVDPSLTDKEAVCNIAVDLRFEHLSRAFAAGTGQFYY